jgi:hypothetical protein
MKKIYCELHLFDLNQTIYIINTETGDKEVVAKAALEEIPQVISAISNEQNISKVLLFGNSIISKAVSEDIIAYSKKHYNWNNIEVEVLK